MIREGDAKKIFKQMRDGTGDDWILVLLQVNYDGEQVFPASFLNRKLLRYVPRVISKREVPEMYGFRPCRPTWQVPIVTHKRARSAENISRYRLLSVTQGGW